MRNRNKQRSLYRYFNSEEKKQWQKDVYMCGVDIGMLDKMNKDAGSIKENYRC